MKKKELKTLANKIFKAEQIIQTSSDKKEINDAKNKIADLSKALEFEDLIQLDEMVQDLFAKET